MESDGREQAAGARATCPLSLLLSLSLFRFHLETLPKPSACVLITKKEKTTTLFFHPLAPQDP